MRSWAVQWIYFIRILKWIELAYETPKLGLTSSSFVAFIDQWEYISSVLWNKMGRGRLLLMCLKIKLSFLRPPVSPTASLLERSKFLTSLLTAMSSCVLLAFIVDTCQGARIISPVGSCKTCSGLCAQPVLLWRRSPQNTTVFRHVGIIKTWDIMP